MKKDAPKQIDPVSQIPTLADDGGWIDSDFKRYRWNLSDGDRPLYGYPMAVQWLPDGEGGKYVGVIMLVSRPTTAKDERGDIVQVPPGEHVILSYSAGLDCIGELVKLARDPHNAKEVIIKKSHSLKTNAGFNVIKTSFKKASTMVPRSALPSTPSYGRFHLEEEELAFPPVDGNGAGQLPAGSYSE